MKFEGKKVLVFGAGKSGIGSVSLLLKVGAKPVLYDGNDKLDPEKLREDFPKEAKVDVVLGDLKESLIESLNLCVMSPGVPTDIEPVNRIRNNGVPIIGEIEFAYRCSKGTVLAVTGTNGKTTTVTLLGEIMKRHLGQDKVFVVGNIGNPYTGAAWKTDDSSTSVAEISSFQLETIDTFHPHVSAITNITPDHLNRHHTMDEYIRVKESITKNQTKDDFVILNYEDEVLRKFGESVKDKVRVKYFSSKRVLEDGMYLDGDVLKIADRKTGTVIDVINIHDQSLLGSHNYENISTAVLCAVSAGVPLDEIREVLRKFKAVEHRIEFVREVNGVTYYNDSKGTNPDAAIRAVLAMNRPTVLIGGGFDKGSTYDEWIESFQGKVKDLVLIGQTKKAIAECAEKHGFTHVYLCGTFREAFDRCVSLAKPGDAVLLSPACASWGMFKNYEERGRIFKDYVRNL